MKTTTFILCGVLVCSFLVMVDGNVQEPLNYSVIENGLQMSEEQPFFNENVNIQELERKAFVTPPKDKKITSRLEKTINDKPNESVIVWVFFADKGVYSREEVSKALEEYRKQSTIEAKDRIIDFDDLPVRKDYIENVLKIVKGKIKHRTTTSWFNGISIEVPVNLIPEIAKLEFVTEIDLVDKLYFPPSEDHDVYESKKEKPPQKEKNISGGIGGGIGEKEKKDANNSVGFTTMGVGSHTMCKDVQSSYPWDPIGITYTFMTSDTKATSWIKWTNIYTSKTVKWKWYKPNGNLYAEYTTTIPSPPPGQYWLWYTTWSWINIKDFPPEVTSGRWKVDVYLDNNYQFTENFDVNIDYGTSKSQLDQIHVPELHAQGYDGSGVKIAIIDQGYRLSHEVFQHLKIYKKWNFIDNNDDVSCYQSSCGHGTKTLSVLGGNEAGDLVGAAYNADFLLAKVSDYADPDIGYLDTWVNAVNWATNNGANVLSSSITYNLAAIKDGVNRIETKTADNAVERGVVFVQSIGNCLDPPSYCGLGSLSPPSDAFNVISVGAVDSSGNIWYKSRKGPTDDGRIKPDVMAQGVNTKLATVDSDASYGYDSGTSFSTPLVAGVAALLFQAHPDWTPNKIKDALRRTASRSASPDNNYGWGIVNAKSAKDASPDGTKGWDEFNVDKATWKFDVKRADSRFQIMSVYRNNVFMFSRLVAPFVKMSSTRYDLTDTYLVSGPRIYEKSDSTVKVRAKYKIGNANFSVEYSFFNDGELDPWVYYQSSTPYNVKFYWYYDTDVNNYPYDYATVSGQNVYTEGYYSSQSVYYKDYNTYPYVQILPYLTDTPYTYVLRYAYNTHLNYPLYEVNGENVYLQNIMAAYETKEYNSITSAYPGPWIYAYT